MKKLQSATIVVFILMIVLYCGVMLHDLFFVDRTAPVIWCSTPDIVVSVKDPQSALLEGVVAEDDRDGDITKQVMIKGVSQLITDNTAQVTYIVFDSADNMATLTRIVRYADYEKPRFSLQQALNYTLEDEFRILDKLTAEDVLDGDISGSICVISQNIMKEPGTYHVTVQATNSLGDTTTIPLKLVVREAGTSELIKLSANLLYLEKGTPFRPESYIASVSAPNGTAVSTEEVNIDNPVDPFNEGTYHVRYSITVKQQTYVVYLTVVVV